MKLKVIDELVERSLNGDKLAIARLISMVEGADEYAPYVMEKIFPHSGKAYYIGVTGPPGVGKSTTVDRLIATLCKNQYSVGVIAVDPSSPFSGGALLGDRIRMHVQPDKMDVFMRSMSSGRVMGGLARTTKEASRILDACGKQVIIIETVGVGQSELDIAEATDTVVVILTPESGDSIQIMKAGLMEIADIFVINKADRPGAEDIFLSVQGMLGRSRVQRDWTPLIFSTSASNNQGIEALYEGIWSHYRYLHQNAKLEERRKRQLKQELRTQIEYEFAQVLWKAVLKGKDLGSIVDDIWQRRADPQNVARKIVEELLADLGRSGSPGRGSS
ncbi:MAG: methylmalonyl Co-A mutase-associated GTPase MeaB [Desulfobaccales bacterium]